MKTRFLIISILFFLTSCTPRLIRDLLEYNKAPEVFSNNYFSETSEDYIYKARIKANSNTFGGLLIIKKLDSFHHRIVFTSDFGNKIFDFELNNGAVTTNFILEQINRKLVINALVNDFQLLTNEFNMITKAYENSSHFVYKTKVKSRNNYFFVKKSTNQLTEIIQTASVKEKKRITFKNQDNNIAKNLTIEHKNIPVTISLVYLN